MASADVVQCQPSSAAAPTGLHSEQRLVSSLFFDMTPEATIRTLLPSQLCAPPHANKPAGLLPSDLMHQHQCKPFC